MKTKKTWEKVLGIFLAAVLVLGMIPLGMWMTREKESHAVVIEDTGVPDRDWHTAAADGDQTIYFKPDDDLATSDARFVARFKINLYKEEYTDVKCKDSDAKGYYSISIPDKCAYVAFLRVNQADWKEDDWDGYTWSDENSTNYEKIPTGESNCFVCKKNGYGDFVGSWKTYTPLLTTNDEKTIYIEAGKITQYTVMCEGNEVRLESIQAPQNLNIGRKNGKCAIDISSGAAGQSFCVSYTGKVSGESVEGVLNVHTYAAPDKTYVFDFGLPSDISATTDSGSGLFQGGTWAIDGVDTTATLTSIERTSSSNQTTSSSNQTTSSSNQTTIMKYGDVTINADGSTMGGSVMFQPVDFMDAVETYTYTVQITADGKTFDANNPETGTTVTGQITVLPANTVYYEDNFQTDDGDYKINYVGGASASGSPTGTQSNDQSVNYGYDPVYVSGLGHSNDSATLLSNGATAEFTFNGTGFDIISTTTGNSGGMKVEVSSSDTRDVLCYVDNMYTAGTLHQVPVVSVLNLAYATYTVKITSLSTFNGTGGVYIDGIRIYNPTCSSPDDYLAAEKDVTFNKIRDRYFNNKKIDFVKNDGTFKDLNGNAVVEDYDSSTVKPGTTWEDLYKNGPNNEIYVPAGNGIKFNFSTSDVDNFTMQIGVKDVGGNPNHVKVYVKVGSKYELVATITVNTATDMYYDLTAGLKEAGITNGTNHELVIVNASTSGKLTDFVSLTTVKCSPTVTLS